MGISKALLEFNKIVVLNVIGDVSYSEGQIYVRACGTCYQRCNCVPSGTSDYYEDCPCYANMTTHNGEYKCP
ncbi:Snakin-2 [Glycine soja]|uniref:Snakin-2 n=1 Tax=Glycine soja TaxID=3848 RepID=A0A0B2PS36_GLYSO|nr:Snakin-2 [Glycine soja]